MSISGVKKMQADLARPPTDCVVHTGDSGDVSLWNQYLDKQSDFSLFHRAEWDRVFRFYRLPTLRIAAMRNGKIVGVLPLVHQASWLFGNQLVSLPWFDAAGVIADDAETRDLLLQEARRISRDRGARHIQLRSIEPLDIEAPERTDKVLMRLSLPQDPESLWKGFRPKVRNQVRKADKSGLTVQRGGRELLGDFFGVYSTNMRDLGSPPHHRRFFGAIFDAFSDLPTIYLIRFQDRVVGAGMTMANGSRLEIPWASSLRTYNQYCVNHLMYWSILEDACRDGFSQFHFGRSSVGSGQYRFKRQWGAEPIQLHWYFLSPDGGLPATVHSPQESYGWATRIWQRLPVTASRLLGPRIIAKVP